jgi:hypothetical protein
MNIVLVSVIISFFDPISIAFLISANPFYQNPIII